MDKQEINRPVILVGYGGHGFVAADILLEMGNSLIGYCDTEEKKLNPYSIPYLGTERDFFIDTKNCNTYAAFIAIGNTPLRKQIFEFLEYRGVSIVNAVHPEAVVSVKASIGKGVFLAAR